MNDLSLEFRAQEHLRHKEYNEALLLFNQLLAHAHPNVVSRERIIIFLLARSECLAELGEFEKVVSDCKKVLKLLSGIEEEATHGSRARRRLVHSLFRLNRFSEAEQAAQEWVACSPGGTSIDALKMLERVRIASSYVNGNNTPNGLSNVTPLQQQLILKNNLKMNHLSSHADNESSWLGEINGLQNQLSKTDNPNLLDINNFSNRNNMYETPQQQTSNFHHPPPQLTSQQNSGGITANGMNFMSNTNNDFMYSALPPSDTASNMTTSLSSLSTTPGTLSEESSLSRKSSVNNGSSIDNDKQVISSNGSSSFNCVYCSLSFSDKNALRNHCSSESHQTVIMSDEGRDWKWRPPPRGFTADNYSLCEWFTEGGETACRYGAQCVEAHGQEELTEWRQRFEYRRMKLERASEKELYGKSYTEQLLERWIQASCPEKVLKEELDDVEVECDNPVATSVSSKVSDKNWTFTLKSNRTIKAVALLQDAHRQHFKLDKLSTHDVIHNAVIDHELPNDQEWLSNLPPPPPSSGDVMTFEHTIKVDFNTEIYGTFRQSVVIDLGSDPVLVKHVCVDVIPIDSVEKIKQIKQDLVLSNADRWEPDSVEIVKFKSSAIPVENESGNEICQTYPPPRVNTFSLTQSTITEKRLTRYNYKPRMHELLYVEEMARYEQVARYNLRAKLNLVDCYLLSPSGVAGSTAKYAQSGELFAVMTLGKDISEDTSAGRLILNNCAFVFISDLEETSSKSISTTSGKRIVYEVYIEDKGKNSIYLRVGASAVNALSLKKDTEVSMDVQFQLNRIPYCEWHQSIDSVADFRIVFPDTYVEPHIPQNVNLCESLEIKLNSKQKEAVAAITAPTDTPIPPVLIIGPFGTGKTYTLANAIKEVLKQDDTRILVCTHSNSAADLYIKDYLHPYVQEGHEEAKPLRIYYHKRWVATVNTIVQQYCTIEFKNGIREFKMPTLEDISKHRVVVVTLSISLHLATVGLKKGHFTHILLDEAAQAMECEAIMPLALANDNTRIVLAGDHMQLSPEIFSQFAKDRLLHISLLERLYDHYPSNFPCKILLCENYRAHEAIIQFTSELFYEQKLISSGNQPKHDKFHPLTFFTTRGEDVQDHNSTAFYNNSEVYEVVERVSELKKRWPTNTWGKLDEYSIGIMTPYADQVVRIRSELRKRRMGGISVERVLNVQGKQFRAIFLSTVRTRRTCSSTGNDDLDYGFLSNSKLLNTAITRAQSLVAVVGDPVALCSIGRCRKVWERFIEICNNNSSLFGITWKSLRAQLDGVELKKTYVLNPLAPEFIPRQFQAESYIRLPNILNNLNITANNSNNSNNQHQMMQQQNVRYQQQQHQPVQPMPPSLYQLTYPTTMVYPPYQSNSNAFIVRPQNNSNNNSVVVAAGVAGPSLFSSNNSVAPSNFSNSNWLPNSSNTPNWSNKKKSELSPPINNDDYRNLTNPSLRLNAATSLAQQQQQQRVISPIDFTNPNTFLRPPPNMLNLQLLDNLGSGLNTLGTPLNASIGLTQNMSSPQVRRMITSNTAPPQQQQQHEKDIFVHFQSPPPPLQQNGGAGINLQNNISAAIDFKDIQNLLPNNISVNELVNSPSKQYEWFTHLVDTAGIESANKFFEFISNTSNLSTLLRKTNYPSNALQQQPMSSLEVLQKRMMPNTSSNSFQNSLMNTQQNTSTNLLGGAGIDVQNLNILENLFNNNTSSPSTALQQQRPHTWYAQTSPSQQQVPNIQNGGANSNSGGSSRIANGGVENNFNIMKNNSLTSLQDLKNYSIREIEAVLLLEQQQQQQQIENNLVDNSNNWNDLTKQQQHIQQQFALYNKRSLGGISDENNTVGNIMKHNSGMMIDPANIQNEMRPNNDLLLQQQQQQQQQQQLQLLQQKYKQQQLANNELSQQQQTNEQQRQHELRLQQQQLQQQQQQQLTLQQLHQQQLKQQQQQEFLRLNGNFNVHQQQTSNPVPQLGNQLPQQQQQQQPQQMNYATTAAMNNPNIALNNHSNTNSNFPLINNNMKMMNGHIEQQPQPQHQKQPQQQQQQSNVPQKPLTYASVLRQQQTVVEPTAQQHQQQQRGQQQYGGGSGVNVGNKMKNPQNFNNAAGGDPFAVIRDLGNKQTGLYQYFS